MPRARIGNAGNGFADRDGVYGSPRFHLAAKKKNIKAHIGAEITVQCPKSNVQSRIKVRRPIRASQSRDDSEDIGRWTLGLDKTSNGGHRLRFRFLSWLKPNRLSKSLPANNPDEIACAETRERGECAVTPDEVAEYAEGLICLTGDR